MILRNSSSFSVLLSKRSSVLGELMIKQANDLNIKFSCLLIMSLQSAIVLIISVGYLLSIAVCIKLMLRCSLTRSSFVNRLSGLIRRSGREKVSPAYSVRIGFAEHSCSKSFNSLRGLL